MRLKKFRPSSLQDKATQYEPNPALVANYNRMLKGNKRKFIPRSLYGRFLFIIIVSALIVQAVSIYVFYYTHLDLISKHMARSVIEEMVFVKKSINKPDYQTLLFELSKETGLTFSFENNRRLKKKKIGDSNWRQNKIYQYINPLIDPYNRFKSELESHNLKPYEIFASPDYDDIIIVKIQTTQGLLSFEIPIKRITSSSAHVFIFWMILSTLLTSIISIIFFRNQVRFVRELSKAAEKFGRGQDVPNLKPAGSEEIRSLTISFIKMKERVMRQITQRTDMLSGVSHDLRTPLTRMKLQLAMMADSEEINELKNDISDMEKLVDEYLDFARSDDKEKALNKNIKIFLQEKIINYYAKIGRNIQSKINIAPDFEMPIKKLALKRSLINLIDNAFNYGDIVELSAELSRDNLILKIDDNGPGIPESEYTNVFKPFYRIDNSRNLDKKMLSGGSGLGLAIAMDGITSHGGRIELGKSINLGGLAVTIYIPI
ncbi:MAG: ATP-binding protein [Rickettsiales bacterium]|nr:ATP-binding protein [Rickettsiales bacterium]